MANSHVLPSENLFQPPGENTMDSLSTEPKETVDAKPDETGWQAVTLFRQILHRLTHTQNFCVFGSARNRRGSDREHGLKQSPSPGNIGDVIGLGNDPRPTEEPQKL